MKRIWGTRIYKIFDTKTKLNVKCIPDFNCLIAEKMAGGPNLERA